MHDKLSWGSLGASRGLDVRLPRTRALLLGLFAVIGWLHLKRKEVEIDVLGEMVLMEAAGQSEGVGGRSELEASMHSSLLRDFQEVTEGIREMEAVAVETGETAATQQNAATPTAFPDSSAVVGRIFQMKVPNKMEDVYLGDIVKVSSFLPPLFLDYRPNTYNDFRRVCLLPPPSLMSVLPPLLLCPPLQISTLSPASALLPLLLRCESPLSSPAHSPFAERSGGPSVNAPPFIHSRRVERRILSWVGRTSTSEEEAVLKRS
ncbi:dystroglycan-like protein [Lates japonicus]|uniref:Dystroglycan-like protein n=1 Tax=Lates japonicus TaxID=270547 RepID=A0AAD3M2X2_LATJO|nr:dystroglycan-like protein [Lates japonicus]